MCKISIHHNITFLNRLLALLLISGLIVACTPSESDLQPTVSFEGSYRGQMSIATRMGSQTFTQTVDDLAVEVKTGPASGRVTVQLFEEGFGAISDPLTATVQGNTLTVARQSTPGYPNDVYEGSGTLAGKQLSLTLNDTFNGATQIHTVTANKQ